MKKPARGKASRPAKAARTEHSLARRATPDKGRLFERIVSILEEARARVARSVNSEMVVAYWQIGREIVETLQAGGERAAYGKQLIVDLSERLTQRLGRGFSTTNLWYFRQFYLVYADRSPKILHKPSGEFATEENLHKARGISPPTGKRSVTSTGIVAALERAVAKEKWLEGFSDRLSWSHYRALTKVEHPSVRAFYEIEADREGWSVPHLERQIHTQLFARLLKSRDKAGVMDLASRGQAIERPIDTIKHPYVLDFLDLPETPRLRESDLESAILEQLQNFLLELGKGFAFVARQKRLSFEDEHFYVDLVFYNVILKCYLLVDLKLGKLTHQDVGQMDSYVRMFDAEGRTAGDGPTIGLILCAEKNEAVARYSVLHGNEQLFAARYVTYLPSEEELARELAREKLLIEAGEVAAVGKRRKAVAKTTTRGSRRKSSPRRKP